MGISSDCKRRVSSISTSNPHEVRLVWSFELESKDVARMAEKMSHNALYSMGRHHKLEWFKCCDEMEIVGVVKKCCAEVMTNTNRLKRSIKKRLAQYRGRKNFTFRVMRIKEEKIRLRKQISSLGIKKIINALGTKEVSRLTGVRRGIITEMKSGDFFYTKQNDVQKVYERLHPVFDCFVSEGDPCS